MPLRKTRNTLLQRQSSAKNDTITDGGRVVMKPFSVTQMGGMAVMKPFDVTQMGGRVVMKPFSVTQMVEGWL